MVTLSLLSVLGVLVLLLSSFLVVVASVVG